MRSLATVILVLLVVATAGSLIVAAAADPLVVHTTSGPVRGFNAGSVNHWYGIPFAAPPTGANRWMPPQPAPVWNDIRDATQFGSQCIQVPGGAGSEDCLTINVFAPAAATSAGTDREKAELPVMAWIHGGGFELGNAAFYDMTRFINSSVNANPVIAVSFQYRLGPLGYLAVPWRAASVSPNYGLLDQQFALSWIQSNIAAFGGDPTRVTVWGESAGGGSVEYHTVIPTSNGLFTQAMMLSPGISVTTGPLGSGIGAGLYGLDVAQQMMNELASAVGCDPTHHPAQLQSCMIAVDPVKLATALQVSPAYLLGPLYSWYPIIDHILLTDTPLNLFSNGQVNSGVKSVVIGTVHDEGSYFTRAYMGNYNLSREQYRWGLNSTFGGTVNLAHAEAPLIAWAQAIDQFYTQQAVINPSEFGTRFERLRAVIGDYQFNGPVRLIANSLSAPPLALPVYVYVYDHAQSAANPLAGVSHSADLAFDFNDPDLTYKVPFTADEQRLADTMVLAWTSFAATGTPAISTNGDVQWSSYVQGSSEQFLVWNTTQPPVVMNGWRDAEYQFWLPFLLSPP